tara:strand:- start:3098 stop:3541 length:444 start_codon:yes stop_codon:yes gene_type:complete
LIKGDSMARMYKKSNELTPGTELSLDVGPITRTDIVRFAGASGDFNPNHHDEIFAIRSGFEKVFAMGPLSLGYLSRMLIENLGPTSFRRFEIRFVSQAWPGDLLTCKGRVVKQYEESGENIIEIDAEVNNQNGIKLVQGTLTAVPEG